MRGRRACRVARAGVAIGGEPYQRAFHIVKQTRPGTGGHTAAGDEHIVVTWGRQARKQEACGFTHPPFRAVALDRPADPLGGSESGADQGLGIARSGLDEDGATRAMRGLRAGQEVRAFPEAFDLEGGDFKGGVGHTDTIA